jgi:hypothetical protein
MLGHQYNKWKISIMFKQSIKFGLAIAFLILNGVNAYASLSQKEETANRADDEVYKIKVPDNKKKVHVFRKGDKHMPIFYFSKIGEVLCIVTVTNSDGDVIYTKFYENLKKNSAFILELKDKIKSYGEYTVKINEGAYAETTKVIFKPKE